ncbi:hypothetical protein PVAP13_8NG213621 [Panicum virgatum]|uniref:DUF4220 domain-containing protein n=1 Tax=Panicum virgatum TaxID=38727 RepID=A0A8T0P798_PANVG|nr:hypothetical protein PVAP13_8NG213621 [Panicum virgatum]
MCKVVDIELSLMYDILYTKAAKIQTCLMSYFIRIASPVTTATMTILFWCSSKDAQRRPDVIITYILLVVTFLLEVRWLLRVTASTWTYVFFNEAQVQGESWLQHQVFCTGRWHRLRRLIISLDPRQLLWWKPRGSYRLWTGTIRKYNLFGEYCSHGLVKDICAAECWIGGSKLGKLGSREIVKELLFEKIMKALGKGYSRDKFPISPTTVYPAVAPPGPASNEILQRRHPLDVALGFVPEFQEMILILHVATDVFLVEMSNQCQHLCEKKKRYKEAIETTSNYMTFLAAARPEMLPGGRSLSRNNLAGTLREVETMNRWQSRNPGSNGEGDHQSSILSEGIIIAELILESWVRLLINVSTRCGRDSHAKQLGRGCELTTIVWILSHHASVFGI